MSGLTSAESETPDVAYEWQDATLDSYWYSLYNMNTTIAVSGVGVLFPHNEQQKKMFKKRLRAILKHSEVDKPPIKNPNLNMAPFTEGDPHFTQKPVAPFTVDSRKHQHGDGHGEAPTVQRIHANTMAWNREEMSHVVSPSSVAWTHLKGVTWAKNFQNHFGLLPENMAAKFRAQMLTTIAQISIKATLVDGGPDGNGALTKNDDNLLLVSGYNPKKKEVVDSEPRPMQHAAMLWFLSDMVSLAEGGWYGYVNPKPLIPSEKLQQLLDGMAKTTMNAFPPEKVVEMGSTRDVGVMLGGMGWYGTHAGSETLRERAAEYANALASLIKDNLSDDGVVQNGTENQAATQGAVGQGLLWASQVEGVSHQNTARAVLNCMMEQFWDEDAGTFATGTDDETYTITARDAGDVTGGLNAADAVLDIEGAQDLFATYFNQTFNRGRLQRAQRPASLDPEERYVLPLPQNAGGKYGQAAVYNTEVTYLADADEWEVTDDRFTTAQALYLANQDVWIGQWGGSFYDGRGVPGETDQPVRTAGDSETNTSTGTGNESNPNSTAPTHTETSQ
ncbi:plasmid stabilization protein [Halopelagius longus]|uniref:Plasmid stabilization protein n=2 Tax=Halopelagius longus TaxID=1236180 RepID=A0A1H1GRL6_9EURY|nr:plasmid stabilization protein [Halopelagius longus]SDR15825.1 hypothetical protein SAMN05216278_3804 [Halopelagius longus]